MPCRRRFLPLPSYRPSILLYIRRRLDRSFYPFQLFSRPCSYPRTSRATAVIQEWRNRSSGKDEIVCPAALVVQLGVMLFCAIDDVTEYVSFKISAGIVIRTDTTRVTQQLFFFYEIQLTPLLGAHHGL